MNCTYIQKAKKFVDSAFKSKIFCEKSVDIKDKILQQNCVNLWFSY